MNPALFLAMMESAAASSFSPLDLGSKLKAWWKPPVSGDNITLNGSAVASWTDEVGGYALSQATAANQPAYDATGFNGRPCATFDGSNDYLDLAPVPAGIPTGANTSELWVVGSQDALGADTSTRFLMAVGGGSERLQMVRRVSGGANRLRVAAVNVSTYQSDNSADLSGAHVMRGVFDATVRADVDDTAGTESSAATYNTPTTRLALGIAASLGGTPWQGTIHEIAVTEPLTAGEAADLLAYLSEGW